MSAEYWARRRCSRSRLCYGGWRWGIPLYSHLSINRDGVESGTAGSVMKTSRWGRLYYIYYYFKNLILFLTSPVFRFLSVCWTEFNWILFFLDDDSTQTMNLFIVFPHSLLSHRYRLRTMRPILLVFLLGLILRTEAQISACISSDRPPGLDQNSHTFFSRSNVYIHRGLTYTRSFSPSQKTQT